MCAVQGPTGQPHLASPHHGAFGPDAAGVKRQETGEGARGSGKPSPSLKPRPTPCPWRAALASWYIRLSKESESRLLGSFRWCARRLSSSVCHAGHQTRGKGNACPTPTSTLPPPMGRSPENPIVPCPPCHADRRRSPAHSRAKCVRPAHRPPPPLPVSGCCHKPQQADQHQVEGMRISQESHCGVQLARHHFRGRPPPASHTPPPPSHPIHGPGSTPWAHLQALGHGLAMSSAEARRRPAEARCTWGDLGRPYPTGPQLAAPGRSHARQWSSALRHVPVSSTRFPKKAPSGSSQRHRLLRPQEHPHRTHRPASHQLQPDTHSARGIVQRSLHQALSRGK